MYTLPSLLHDEFTAQDHYKSTTTAPHYSDTLDGVHNNVKTALNLHANEKVGVQANQKNQQQRQHLGFNPGTTTHRKQKQQKPPSKSHEISIANSHEYNKNTNNKYTNNTTESTQQPRIRTNQSQDKTDISDQADSSHSDEFHELATTINKQTVRVKQTGAAQPGVNAKHKPFSVNLHKNLHKKSPQNTNNSIENRSKVVEQAGRPTTTTTTNNMSDHRRTKVVTFVKNGDLNHVKTVQVTPHRYGHFEELLMDLDKAIGLPYGVRRVYTPDSGHRVNSIDQLLDQGIYVCTGFEKFKPINYARV